MTDMRAPLARVRGRGSAKSGSGPWLGQRLTGIANLFLVLWFAVSVAALAGSDYATVVWWVRDPVVSVLLIVLVANLFWHLRLGLAVVIEDYIESASSKFAAVLAVNALSLLLALAGILAILKISLGG